MSGRYPIEVLSEDHDDGTMVENLYQFERSVVGRRIVKVGREDVERRGTWGSGDALVLTLDDGTRAVVWDTNDCCAYTEASEFWLHPESVDHVILGVGTTGEYTKWHIYADFGDVMTLNVRWSSGNPFYYGYGFEIIVEPLP